MKLLPTVLGCTLTACLAMFSSSAAWSKTEAGAATPAPKKAVVKKAKKLKKYKKASRTGKRRVIALPTGVPIPALPAAAPVQVTPPSAPQVAVTALPAAVVLKEFTSLTALPAAPTPVQTPAAVVVNRYLPGSSVPLAAKPNAYLPNPYLPSAAPVLPQVAATGQGLPTIVYKPPFATTPAVQRASAAAPAPAPALPATPPAAAQSARYVNPYLANSMAMVQTTTYAAAPVALPSLPAMPGFPELSSLGLPSGTDVNKLMGELRNFLPDLHMPSADIDVLPSIKKVFPTGERPMYVLTFKCPTELVGVTPPPTKALRWLIDSGMEAINETNVLPFSMQQVCQ